MSVARRICSADVKYLRANFEVKFSVQTCYHPCHVCVTAVQFVGQRRNFEYRMNTYSLPLAYCTIYVNQTNLRKAKRKTTTIHRCSPVTIMTTNYTTYVGRDVKNRVERKS